MLLFTDCQILKQDRPKPFTFTIRGLQMTTVVERMFAVDSEAERQDWLSAIQSVAQNLKVSMCNDDILFTVCLYISCYVLRYYIYMNDVKAYIY